jgi:radical SAM protein
VPPWRARRRWRQDAPHPATAGDPSGVLGGVAVPTLAGRAAVACLPAGRGSTVVSSYSPRLGSPRQAAVARASVGPGLRHLRFDVGARPFLVLFELTRACDLACRHCRAEAMPDPDPDELSTEEVCSVLDDLAGLGPPRPIVVLSGGDPLRRADLEAVVRHGASSGLPMATSPAGTPRASPARLAALRQAGSSVVSFSLDGASPATHDGFRRVEGSFAQTLLACRAARAVGLRLQVNTTVSAETVGELPAICRLVAALGVNLWSVFFLVPSGRGRLLRALSAPETEDVLHFLYEASHLVALKTTEAPQYRRVLLQRQAAPGGAPVGLGPLYQDLHRRLEATRGAQVRQGVGAPAPPRRRSPLVVGDGRGVVFVSHRGDVTPSGFLPLVTGNVRQTPLSAIYAGSPLLRALRDTGRLRGRCGRCELAEICGGSRARAYASSGDPLGEDPSCAYDPAP